MEKNNDADEKEERLEKLRKDLFSDEDRICWVDPEDASNSIFNFDDNDDKDEEDEDVTDLFDFDDDDEYPDEYPEYNPRG